ncbi:MAG: hypothetical protein WA801_04785, partial [Pseudolabrys sp.]
HQGVTVAGPYRQDIARSAKPLKFSGSARLTKRTISVLSDRRIYPLRQVHPDRHLVAIWRFNWWR